MSPQMKADVFDTIQKATTKKMSRKKVMRLTNQIIELFVENDLEYSQAHAIMDCVGITLVARSQLMKP